MPLAEPTTYRHGDTTGLKERVAQLPLKVSEEDEKTGAGNYFVANYPPFSFWKPEHVDALEDVLATEPDPATPLGLYFHIPFCRKRCHFCYFRVYTDKSSAEINGYIQAAMEEMESYAETAYLKGRKPKFVYFGGGTPSYLSIDQLTNLMSRMKAAFPWDEVEEVAFEAEPGTLTDKKLKAIKDLGVTRLSIGVESFDDHLLELNGRAHRSAEIERAYATAKSLNFDQLNIDLIAGMVDESEENWKRSVEKAIELDPECVTIYQMEIPYNTTIYKEMQDAGKLTAPVADWPTKRRWVKEAFEMFEKAGYTVTSATTVVKDPSKTKFIYRDALWEGADLLPLGVASFGHLGGVHLQNNADVGPYMEKLDQKELPVFRAYPTNVDERFIREFILMLKLGEVKPSYFQEKFGEDPLDRFAPELTYLEGEGFLEVGEDRIGVTRDGLMQIDRLLHSFFLSNHRNARYT